MTDALDPTASATAWVPTPWGPVRCLGPAGWRERTRDAGQPTVLLIHGSGGSADVWRPMAAQLAGLDWIAIDLPGHGETRTALLDSVADCTALIDALGDSLQVERWVIVGQSLGGALAQHYARDRPQRCAGIVIANSAPDFTVSAERFRQIAERWEETVRVYAAGQVSQRAGPELRAAARRMIEQRDPQVFAHDLRVCNGFSSRAWAAALAVPVLIIAGHDDVLTTPARSVALLELIGHAEMVVFSPCGHCTMLEQPERFAAEIARFVARVA